MIIRIFAALLVAVPLSLAQNPDPSIGRNLPGGVPQTPVAGHPPAAPKVDAPAAFPVASETGIPGSRALRNLHIVTDDGVEPRLIAENRDWLNNLHSLTLKKPLTLQLAQDTARATLELYFAANRPFVFIQIQELNYEIGSLKILVVEGTLGAKSVTGNRWFSTPQIESNIRAEVGQPIDRLQLLNDVAWIGQNPFIRAEPVFSAGAAAATTDITLEAQDRFPVRAFASIDNTGDDQTGEWRWTLGGNWGNAFDLGHQLSYQFSASIDDIAAQPVNAMNYTVPLPWRHLFTIYGNYSSSEVDLSSGTGTAAFYNGDQWSISPRYIIPIGPLFGATQQQLSVGMDFKRSDLGFLQGGTVAPTNQTDVVQWMAGYSLTHRDGILGGGITNVSAEVYISPGGVGERNTTSEFQKIDPRLDADYVYSTMSASRLQRLPYDFSLFLEASAQVASHALISSEQLAIGGYGTVRGYKERVLFGDQGVVLNAEIHTPPFSPSERLGLSSIDEIQFLCFWDFGLASSKNPLPGDDSSYSLSSVGAGLRYSLGENFNARCDIGFPLEDPNLGFSVSPRVSVGATVTF
jgi:hemolysin activation/secretion protein